MFAIIERLTTYRLNVGANRIVWNLLVLGLVLWLITTMPSPAATAVFAGVIALGLACGMAVIPFVRTRTKGVSRVIDAAWWLAMVFFGLNFFKISPFPLLTSLGVLFCVMFGLSGSFWLFSTPGLINADGYKRLMSRVERQEALRRIAEGDDPSTEAARTL